ncbi:hypothetical protein MP638_007540 [Amoeboaphelidium occidentale]|nr:hypothetical protein MP638_007540 [Amoeboaphelidium occidentale]
MNISFYESSSISGTFSNLTWSRYYPGQAAATMNQELHILSVATGQISKQEVKVFDQLSQSQAVISCLCWNPKSSLIAIGSNDGNVIVYDTAARKDIELKSALKTVSCLEWSYDGNLLIAGDDSGTIVLWKISSENKTLIQNQLWSTTRNGKFIGAIYLEPQKQGSLRAFLMYTYEGSVCFVDEAGNVEEERTSKTIVGALLDRGYFVVLCSDLILIRFTITSKGLDLEKQFNLVSENVVNSRVCNLIMIKEDVYGVVYAGASAKLIEWSTGYISEVAIPDTADLRMNTIAFCKSRKIMTVGTDTGHAFFWKCENYGKSLREFQWKPYPKLNFGGAIETILWSPSEDALAVKKKGTLHIVLEKQVLFAMSSSVVILQTGSRSFKVQGFTKKKVSHEVNTERNIKALDISDKLAIVSCFDGTILVYKLEKDKISQVSNFSSSATFHLCDDEYIYMIHNNRVEVVGTSGETKQTVKLSFKDAKLLSANMNGTFLVILNSELNIFIMDLSSKEKKIVFQKELKGILPNIFPQVVKVNKSGSLVSVQGKNKCAIVDAVRGVCLKTFNDCTSSCFWDYTDERLFAIENSSNENNTMSYAEVFVFDSTESKLYSFDKIFLPTHYEVIMGLKSPYLILAEKESDSGSIRLVSQILDEFNDENVEESNIKKTLDFSINVLSGKIHELMQTDKEYKNPKVWESAARMSARAGIVLSAESCLGLMRQPYRLHYIRHLNEKEKLLEISEFLGLSKDYSSLDEQNVDYKCKIKHLLEKHDFERAIEMSEKHYRIGLKHCYFAKAQREEQLGNFKEAAINYCKSGNGTTEIGRMLQQYPNEYSVIMEGCDVRMEQWWAKYAESQGSLEEARDLYEKCKNYESLVRVLCKLGEIEKATEVAISAESKPACFQLAKYFNSQGDFSNAVKYFGKASCFHHACMIAKDNQMYPELLQMAMLGGQTLMLNMALVFEEIGLYDKAANLYYKGGRYGKAIQLCLEHKLDQLLDLISSDANHNQDQEAVELLARHFATKGDSQKTLDLLIKSCKIDEALKLARARKFKVTEDLAESITKRISDEKSFANEEKQKNLVRLADLCFEQGSYQLASKKYTQAGDRLQAMKALLKTGDIEKITFFAGVSGQKDKEVYVVAANYLQSVAWNVSENAEILKSAKAFEHLASFYELYAQNEIDFYSDYEKAIGPLKEAIKLRATQIEQNATNSIKTDLLQKKLVAIERYIIALSALRNQETNQMEQFLKEILGSKNEFIVRKGDVLGSLITYYYSKGDKQKAGTLLEVLLRHISRGQILNYIDEKILHEYQHLLKPA